SLGENKKVSTCYTLTVAWVILLCVLFLAALAVLWITFSTMTTENKQLQISNINLISQKDQLQISNNNLINQRNQLQISNNDLIKRKDQLEKENEGLQNKLTRIDAYTFLGWSYFNSSFYYISTNYKPWNDSRQDCLHMGADLVIINSMDEENFVDQQLRRGKDAWIGLHDDGSQKNTKEWKWVDGTPLTL
ncbi:antigen like protein, partial [Clarias magur]